jgi:flagella basal body P-ring formation protein FlgA
MRRTSLIAVLHAAALALVVAAVPAVAAPELRGSVVVDGPVVRLGDLFSAAGPHANAPIANAPAPGTKQIFDSVWLAARAREQGLDWQPRSRYDQVTVERAGQVITGEAIAEEVRRALGDKLPAGQTRIELDNPALRLVVASDAAAQPLVENLVYNARGGRFTATLAAGADSAAEPIRFGGRVFRMIDMPVLTRALAPGEMIAAADIETIAVKSERLGEGYVTSAAELVGKTPRRAIRPGDPVRPTDIQAPIVIHKGELVTIVLQARSMVLTAQGKALDDGARGATIRISNTRSSRVVEAIVTAPGTAAVAVALPTIPVVAQRQE